MIVYFDESYDNKHHYLLYGALFIPDSSMLHQRLLQLRAETSYHGEVKYHKCKNAFYFRVYSRFIDAFMEDQAYFRSVVVDQHRFDYSRFARPDESRALAQARAYKKFAEMLLHPNVQHLSDAVFLADQLTRCRGDEFLERIRERFNPPGSKQTFRHLAEVDSSVVEYQCLQVCDLLLGCVLNNLKPTKNQFKNQIREHLCKKLDVSNLLPSTWQRIGVAKIERECPKFNVWYWIAKKRPR